MGKSAGTAPQAPDPAVTIPLQTAANKSTFDYALQGNRFNQITPTGSQTWTRIPGMPEAPPVGGSNPAIPTPVSSSTPATFQGITNTRGPGGDYVQSQPAITPPAPANPASNLLANPSTGSSADQWTLTNSLSPNQQALFNTNEQSQLSQSQLLKALTDRLGGSLNTPVDYSNAPALTGSLSTPTGLVSSIDPGAKTATPDAMIGDRSSSLSNQLGGYQSQIANLDPKAFSQNAADAVYNQSTRYLDPQVQQQQHALEARLSEQGFVPGTPGYQQAMQNFQNTNNQAYADARDRATTQGFSVGGNQFGQNLSGIQAQIASALSGANYGLSNDQSRSSEALNRANFGSGEQTNQFNRGLASGNFTNNAAQQLFQDQGAAGQFGNQARTQSIAELLQQRAQPLNELNAIRSGTQVQLPTGTPQGGAGSVQPTDVMGAYNNAYQGQVANYNAQVGQDNSLMGLLGQLGLAGGMYFSDRRLKENIRHVGKTVGGNNVYHYRIFDRDEYGVMAQELLEKQPEAVSVDPSGFLLVDYSKVR